VKINFNPSLLVQSGAKASAQATAPLTATNVEIANISDEWHKRQAEIAQVDASTDTANSGYKAFRQFLT